MKIPLITATPEILDGTPVFGGTHVPVKTFTDYLENGSSIDEFLDDFPTVTRVQAVQFLEDARAQLIAALP